MFTCRATMQCNMFRCVILFEMLNLHQRACAVRWGKYIDNQAFQIDFLRCCGNFKTIDALLSMEFQIRCIHMVFILGESIDAVRWMHGLFAQMLIVRTVQMEYFQWTHLWRLHSHITYSRSVVGFHYCFHMIFDFNLNCGKWNEISIHLKIELFIRMHENQLFNFIQHSSHSHSTKSA